MTPLYEKLVSADAVDCRQLAGSLISDMHDGSEVANWEFARLVQTVLFTEFVTEPSTITSRGHGEFTAEAASELLMSVPRTSGYIRAIGEAGSVATAIDAGTGPGAILAVAAAIMHGTNVRAYEINPKSARCARRIVELLGLKDYIIVYEGDILFAKLKRADLGITETFGPAIGGGMQGEHGADIVAKLAEVCAVVLPKYARIHAHDVPTDHLERLGSGWRHATWVDMAQPTRYVEGYLESSGGGMRRVGVYGELFTAARTPVLCRSSGEGLRRDDVLAGVDLGGVTANQGDVLGFRYWISPDSRHLLPEVWNETTGEKGLSEESLSGAGDVSVIY